MMDDLKFVRAIYRVVIEWPMVWLCDLGIMFLPNVSLCPNSQRPACRKDQSVMSQCNAVMLSHLWWHLQCSLYNVGTVPCS
jgi:hypothetical protein